jgi:sugar O-acyltransferase (sialic acid O-acetyltransferase NeuD family)
MIEIIIPQEDANSDTGKIINISIENKSLVKKGEILFEIETSKAVFEIPADKEGYVVYTFSLNDEIEFNSVVGYILESECEAIKIIENLKNEKKFEQEGDIKLTAKAKKLIQQHSLDISSIKKKGIVTEKDIFPLLGVTENSKFLHIDKFPPNMKRVLLVGGGYGAHQVIDIFRDTTDVFIVGILDDNPSKRDKTIMGYNILGGIDKIEDLFAENIFTHLIVAVSGNIKFRKSIYNRCQEIGIPLINAIDKSCTIRSNVTIGQGNVICGNTYIGSFTQIGDNNFISASTSIDHHNIWHSHISIGPSCSTSGLVEIKSGCRLGMGVLFEPDIVIEENCTIASGATITSSISCNTLIRVKSSLRRSVIE